MSVLLTGFFSARGDHISVRSQEDDGYTLASVYPDRGSGATHGAGEADIHKNRIGTD